MRGELVALDLETTGLDFMQDAIIEVGAIRIKDGKIIDEFSTMVNPNTAIPPQTSYITGIYQQDVINAPNISVVLPQIVEFVQDAPVIAHNIAFDMGFLQERHQVLQKNKRIDTYDLASILIPNAPRYNLNSLTQQAGIVLENAHRALDDARATALLYWELWQKAVNLPRSILKEITDAGRHLNWDTGLIFEAALHESQNTTHIQIGFEPLNQQQPQLIPNEAIEEVATDQLKTILGENGALQNSIPEFEYRQQQLDMATAITESFNASRHLMVEAGTGTGKSFAYLIPAILWSVKNNERVVISTNTINLQDQLIQQDIPLLRDVLDVEFTASVMKGRSNYLCPRRLESIRRRKPTSEVELLTLAKILVWLQENKSGDKGEINLRGAAENSVWQHLSAKDDDCTTNQCEAIMHGVCPFHQARKAAETANLLIVNHALLVSDAGADNQVLPDYRYAIIDEAHHLENAITSGLSHHLDKHTLSRHLGNLGNTKFGIFGEVMKTLHGHISEQEAQKLEKFINIISDATKLMNIHIDKLFLSIEKVISDKHSSKDFTTLVRITSQHRGKTAFAEMQSYWATLEEFFEVINTALLKLTKSLKRMKQIPADLHSSIETSVRHLSEIHARLHSFIINPDSNTIYWVTIGQPMESPVIHMAPLHIGKKMEQHIWNNKESVILTSATLRAQDSFDFIRERLFADHVNTLEVGSPFDYRSSTLLYMPNDIPEPFDRQNYQKGVERAIIELATMLEGRVLALFTSYTQLRQTSQAITPRLALGNITVYDQSDGSSRQALLDGFKSTERAVLLGTKSFWEGIDIPGNSLSALIITRLPFAVPSDPIFAARSDTYANAFNQYALPDAILRFRQGFGRLIRSRTDRGVVVVLDSRILSKQYGIAFQEALPDCTMQDGALSKLPEVAQKWLGR